MSKFLKRLTRLTTKLTWGFSLSLVVIIFAASSMLQANASSSRGVLPISKGGTGTNGFPPNKILITDPEAQSWQTIGTDANATQNSNNLVTSGTVFNAFGQSNLTLSDVITLNSDYTAHNSVKARKLGPFVLLQGAIRINFKIIHKTSYTLGTFKSPYKPHPHIAATCSNNFVNGEPATGGGSYRFDCGVDSSTNFKFQSNGNVDYTTTYININFLYLIDG
ncbi:MAG: hypothetical protein LBT99_04535 [Bifidobacteriaceae bacterium]|jgi:hypothetical protein|nr:hypothetical protein [Bifidobacteriaceae bacterium]